MVARIVVAGTASHVGKTTVTVALCRALRARGLRVASFKCGPDYLDPTYHARASGVVCHNLDGFMMGKDAVRATFERASRGADIALLEGVMGLFDGASPISDEGSTAEIAKWLQAPVLLVCDASGMARSVAALARGFARFDPELALAGVICNRVGSRGHLELLRKATAGIPPVVGGFSEQAGLAFPERHLGLRTADESVASESVLEAWGALAAQWLDLDAIVELARSAPALPGGALQAPEARPAARCRIGIAQDEAFHFYYEDNLQRLSDSGAELVRFSPLHDQVLPAVDGLYLGGGYPEVHAARLAANSAMRAAITAFAASGAPIYAECGGLMYLSAAIRTLDGAVHPMVGLFAAEARVHERLQALGYVEVETQTATILGAPGLRFRGHQFRYSELIATEPLAQVYSLRRRRSGETAREGYHAGNVLASYVHAHWASNPQIARGFVAACVKHKER